MTDQELTELREQAEKGRKAQIAKEIFSDFLTVQRAIALRNLENLPFEELQTKSAVIALYFQVLKDFEANVQYFIDEGEISERELNNNGK